jgi:hypothetical protein
VRRSLNAGRVAGSAKNRHPWRFLVLGDVGWSTKSRRPSTRLPDLLGAPLMIAIVVSGKVRSPSTPGARPRT